MNQILLNPIHKFNDKLIFPCSNPIFHDTLKANVCILTKGFHMGLEILNHTDQKLISNADFWQLVDLQRESNKFSEFKGVSFISNIKFIEKNLLPRFDQITLILGLTYNGSNSIGKRIDQILNKRRDLIEYSYEHQDSPFTKRILDGSLQLFHQTEFDSH